MRTKKLAKDHTQQILKTVPKTSTTVNRALADLGIKERLVRGEGYWYFTDGNSSAWFSASVPVYRITSYTVEGWLEQWAILLGDWRNGLGFSVEYGKDRGLLIIKNRVVQESGNVISIIRAIQRMMATEGKKQ